MISHLHDATAAALEEVDGWVVLPAMQCILPIVLRDDSLLWVFHAVAQAHEDRGKEGLVTAIPVIVDHRHGCAWDDATLGQSD